MNNLNKKLLIAAGTLAFLLTGLLVTLRLMPKPQIIEKEAVEKVATLSLSPSSGTYNKDQQFAVNIFLDTGERNVVGVDISLTFDAEKLQVQEVTPGSLFENQIIFKNEVSGNKILLSLGSFTPYNGNGIYGTVQFLATAVGTASVNFDPSPNTKVSQEGEGDILDQATGGSYEITEGTAIPSPTPTGQATPTPTSTIVPTSTPTQIPTSTPTPSPTPSPTATPGVGGPPEPTATPTSAPTKVPTSTPKPTSTPTTKPDIGGLAEPTSTPTPITQVGMGGLTSSTPTPTPVQLPSAGFALPSIFVILTGALLIISAIILI